MLLLVDDATGEDLRRHRGRARAAPAGATSTVENGVDHRGEGLRRRSRATSSPGSTRSSPTSSCRSSGDSSIRAEGLSHRGRARSRRSATTRRPTPSRTSRPVSSTRDNGKGSYVDARRARSSSRAGGPTSGSTTSRTIFTDPLIRDPFVSRLRLDVRLRLARPCSSPSRRALPRDRARTSDGLRFQRIYRSLLIIPYAIPAFLSLLVWRGLLNDDFGVDQHASLGLDIPWLFDPFWAKVSCLLVNSGWLPVLLPRLHRRAPGDPRRADRGGARRRRAARSRCSARSRCRCCSSPSRRC